MKSIYETLAALGTGAILMSGCGAAPPPVAAADVPAATDSKPSVPVEAAAVTVTTPADAAASAAAGGAAAGATAGAAPAPAAAAAAVATPGPAAKAALKGAPGVKKSGTATSTKKVGADGKCGEGSCS